MSMSRWYRIQTRSSPVFTPNTKRSSNIKDSEIHSIYNHKCEKELNKSSFIYECFHDLVIDETLANYKGLFRKLQGTVRKYFPTRKYWL